MRIEVKICKTKINISMIFYNYSMIIGKISNKGQIVIPKKIREKLGIKSGDGLIFRVKDNYIIIEKIEEKLADILKHSKPIMNSLEFQSKMRDEWD